jgi:hypothetical protein
MKILLYMKISISSHRKCGKFLFKILLDMRVTRVIYGKFFLQRHQDFMRIDFENFKIFLIITRVKILLGVEF